MQELPGRMLGPVQSKQSAGHVAQSSGIGKRLSDQGAMQGAMATARWPTEHTVRAQVVSDESEVCFFDKIQATVTFQGERKPLFAVRQSLCPAVEGGCKWKVWLGGKTRVTDGSRI